MIILFKHSLIFAMIFFICLLGTVNEKFAIDYINTYSDILA